MSTQLLLICLNELRKRDKMQGFAEHFITFFFSNFINLKIFEHQC